jgi:hypothetical protein
VGRYLESLGYHLVRTSDDDPEDLGLHYIDEGQMLRPILIEEYSREVGVLADDESVFEWY